MGVSFTRLEFSINNAIGLRPMALLNYDTLDAEKKAQADHRMWRYSSPKVLYINQVAEGVASLDASVYSKRIIVRLSDIQTNGHNSLVVGEQYEPDEENSIFGFRCCGRYADQFFKECFGMEGDMDMGNLEILIPLVRTLDMAEAMGDVVSDERVRILMAHWCFLVCSAAECICYSHAAFKPGLLLVSGCAYT